MICVKCYIIRFQLNSLCHIDTNLKTNNFPTTTSSFLHHFVFYTKYFFIVVKLDKIQYESALYSMMMQMLNFYRNNSTVVVYIYLYIDSVFLAFPLQLSRNLFKNKFLYFFYFLFSLRHTELYAGHFCVFSLKYNLHKFIDRFLSVLYYPQNNCVCMCFLCSFYVNLYQYNE